MKYIILLVVISACAPVSPPPDLQPNQVSHNVVTAPNDAKPLNYLPSGSYCFTCLNCTVAIDENNLQQQALTCSCGDGDGGYKTSTVNLESSLTRPGGDLITITNKDGTLVPDHGGNTPITPTGTLKLNNQICGKWYKNCTGALLIVAPSEGAPDILSIISMRSICEGQMTYLPIQGNCTVNDNGNYTVNDDHGQLYCDN